MDTLKPVSFGLFVVRYELIVILVETIPAIDVHMSIPGTARPIITGLIFFSWY